MYSQTRTKSSVKYAVRKMYKIFLHKDLDFKVVPYKYIENSIEIEWSTGESIFAMKNALRVWAESGRLEILEL